MSPNRIIIRPFLAEDYPAEQEIELEYAPMMAVSVEEIRHEDEVMAALPDHLNLKIVAETSEDSRVVAVGALSQPNFNFHPEKYWIGAWVRTAFRGRGIGSALYSVLEMEARARNATTLWAGFKDDDPRARAFVERRGFVPQRTIWISRLDLRSADLRDRRGLGPKLEAEGVRFSTLRTEGPNDPEVRRKIHALWQLCARDVPRLGEFHPATFEHFQAMELDNTMALPEGFFLAIQGADYVGMSNLQRSPTESDTLRVGFTGTHPRFRGRGLASEMKRRATEFARDAGYSFVTTGNDSLNPSILAINQRMGFRPEIAWVTGEKSLTARG